MQSDNLLPVAVTCSVPSRRPQAQALAESLGLPFLDNPSGDMSLALTETRLELRQHAAPGRPAPGPLVVDFLAGSNGYRLRHNRTVSQPLARAIGIKPGFRPTVVDGTAGLGGDAFVLACLGCDVTMIERSPVLGALLADGLRRALADMTVGGIIRGRLRLILADTQTALRTMQPKPQTIYLDPMYPKRTKSALNKKEMRIIRVLVGDDPDAGALLASALATAVNRVVVKRPIQAPALEGRPPSHVIRMKNSRFDVYLTGPAAPAPQSPPVTVNHL